MMLFIIAGISIHAENIIAQNALYMEKRNAKKKTLKSGKTFRVKVKLPKNTASNTITYISSNTKVAAVNRDGKIKAKRAGKASVTAKTFNGRSAAIHLTVK